MYNIEELDLKLLSELRVIAEKMNVPNFKKLQKKELVYKILDQQALNPTVAASVRKEVASSSTFSEEAETTNSDLEDNHNRSPRASNGAAISGYVQRLRIAVNSRARDGGIDHWSGRARGSARLDGKHRYDAHRHGVSTPDRH